MSLSARSILRPAQWHSSYLAGSRVVPVRNYVFPSSNSATQIAMLSRPIGDEKAPSPTDNTGIDTRTRAEKKADFTNYERHLARRREL